MTFKITGEKSETQHPLPVEIIGEMVRIAYPDQKLISAELIASGCANHNLKIQLEGTQSPLLLRIYLRDPEAAFREEKLALLLKNTIPVPSTHYIGEIPGHRFALTEFMPGIYLRDLLLSNKSHIIEDIVGEVVKILAKIETYQFPNSGSFDRNLIPLIHSPNNDLISFAKNCLQN